MEFKIRDQDMHIEMENDAPVAFFHFSDYGDIDTMREFAQNIDVGTKENFLTVGVPIANIVDFTLDCVRLGFPYKDELVAVSTEARPLLESVKAALLEAIAKIDAVQYVEEDQYLNRMVEQDVQSLIGVNSDAP